MGRRSWLRGAAALGAVAAVPAAGLRTLRAEAAPPFPVEPEGRLIPRDPQQYADAMLSGGPGKDGIPSIDNPVFWDPEEAGEYLDDGDIVFGIVVNGVARAYPQRILVWHEIVNDTIAGEDLAVTYCPLTGTAITYERNGVEFGVSGRLVNSNLIMYDRSSDTWLPQVLSAGIRGPHAGAAPKERATVWTTWGRWRAQYPDTEVLSTQTGFARNYNRDPYGTYNPVGGYYEPDSTTMFPLMHEDARFPMKAVVLGARTADAAVAFPKDRLREAGRLELSANGETFTAVYDAALDTGYIFRGASDADHSVDGFGPHGVAWSGGNAPTPVNAFDAMWFAWAAFYPETAVHE